MEKSIYRRDYLLYNNTSIVNYSRLKFEIVLSVIITDILNHAI